MGQQFAADLARLVPTLNIVCWSSNWVLGVLQQGPGHVEPSNFTISRDSFIITPETICFGISQSGTTYPSVWASRVLRVRTPHVFCLSGNFDTLLSHNCGQRASDDIFTRRVFSTLSDVRSAEPSTVATIAMHHTLTHLLVAVCRDAEEYKYGEAPSVDECSMIVDSLQTSSRLICGRDECGEIVESQVHDELLVAGKIWAAHLSEPYWSLFMTVAYILCTVTAGFAPVHGIFAKVAGAVMDDTYEEKESIVWYQVVNYVTLFFDSLLYIFLCAWTAMILRAATGIRLTTRFTARTILISDSTMNYKLMRAYLSKLKALTRRFNNFGVCAHNSMDHLVHEYTHLANSDVLVACGRPDGRMASLAATESAV